MADGIYPSVSASEGGWTGSSLPDLLPYPHYPVIAEAYPTGLLSGLYSSIQSGPTKGIDEGSRTIYPEIPVPQSTFSGYEGVPPSSIEDSACIDLADVDTACNSRKDDMTTNCTGLSTLTLTGISRKKCAAVSLRPTGRPAGMHKALKRTYSCNICGKRYSQQQNVLRHQRKAHSNPHPCIVTGCGFKWTRPYVYRKHLKCHSDCVNPEEALGKPAGSRHRSNIIGRDLPPPVNYPDQRSQAESRQHSMTQPLPAAANVTYAPLSAMSLVEVVVYDLPPEHAEPAITTCKHEDACRLEFIGAINSPSVFSECAQPVNDLSIHGGQTWLQSAHPGRRTAADGPSNPVALHIPTPIPPTAGHYSNPVYADPVAGPSLFTYSHQLPVADQGKPLCPVETNAASTSTLTPADSGQVGDAEAYLT